MFCVTTPATKPPGLEFRKCLRARDLAGSRSHERLGPALPDARGVACEHVDVAVDQGSRRSQSPPGERKSGSPLAVEMPAPVSASTGAWRCRKRTSDAASGSEGHGYGSYGMTIALCLIAAVAWTSSAIYLLVPISRAFDAYVASLLVLSATASA